MREKTLDSLMWKISWASVFAVAVFASSSEQALSQEITDLTFTRDVASIIQKNCQLCHREGSIGPMPLITYEQVKLYALLIKLKVTTQQMPPYHYDTNVGIQSLKSDKRLSAQEIDTIAQWVDQGAIEGDLADMPPLLSFPDMGEWRLKTEYGYGEPDLVVQSRPFTVPTKGQDLWWRSIVPTGITSDRYVKAIEVKPSLDGYKVVHHANTEMHIMKKGALEKFRFTEYALGKLGEIVPNDAARHLPVDSYIRWDIHYVPMGEEVKNDQVELGFWLHPEGYKPEYKQDLINYLLRGDLDIAPHGTTMMQAFYAWDHPVRIDSFQPHGHLRMVAMSSEIFYPETGKRAVMSMVSNWNPNWHLSHIYEDDVAPLVPTGAIVILTAWYDNTKDNIHNPDPNVWVGRGNRTVDEMSHAWMAVTHLDDKGYERLKTARETNAHKVDSKGK